MTSEEIASSEPPTWLVMGNIIGERACGENGSVIRAGTRLFRPNARCYLAGWHELMAVLHPHRKKSLVIFCQQRQSRKWISSYVNSTYVGNWRVTLEYKPSVIRGIREGFVFDCVQPFDWKGDRKSPEAIKALLEAWGARFRTKLQNDRPGPNLDELPVSRSLDGGRIATQSEE